jgi:hypothetical protein
MPYYLHFYSLPVDAAIKSTEPEAVREFIPILGTKVGELELGAGESMLFITATEELLSMSLFELLEGPVRGVYPDSDVPFGGMDGVVADRLCAAIDRLLANLGDHDGKALQQFRAVAHTSAFDPDRLSALLESLSRLIKKATVGGSDVATIYD